MGFRPGRGRSGLGWSGQTWRGVEWTGLDQRVCKKAKCNGGGQNSVNGANMQCIGQNRTTEPGFSFSQQAKSAGNKSLKYMGQSTQVELVSGESD